MNVEAPRSIQTTSSKYLSNIGKWVFPHLLLFISSALTKDEIKAQAFLFFAARYDTTANALCWLIYNLAWNLEIQEKVYDEIKSVTRENVSLRNDLHVCSVFRFYVKKDKNDRTVNSNSHVLCYFSL